MDRQTIYPGQVPIETDLLLTNRNTMTALAKICSAILGVATAVSGFATAQAVVPALTVLVAPGEIYSLQNLDGTAYSSLAADTTHSILKQGISLDAVTLAITPPSTAGFSINYLIQVGYQDADTGSTVLPYYNASNPSIAYSGPANSGAAQPTKRAGIVSIQAKAGVAATTGTQTTPAPDAGYTGLYVVTVANGASTIVNGNISALASAPFINSTLHGLVPTFTSPVVVGAATQSQHAVQLSQVGAHFAVLAATGNFTVPAGVYSLDVEVWGGGGGGGGIGSAGNGSAGGGGGGGYARAVFAVAPGQVIAGVIGVGGAAGAVGGAGGAGGTTTFLTLSGAGGLGGSPNGGGTGGAGGAGTGGTTNSPGSGGSGGLGAGASGPGGPGGSAAGGGSGGGSAIGLAGGGSLPGGGGGGTGSSVAQTGSLGARGQINIRY